MYTNGSQAHLMAGNRNMEDPKPVQEKRHEEKSEKIKRTEN